MKKLIIPLIIICLLFGGNDVHATNTYSTSLNGSSQAWSIADASQTGLEPTGDFTVEAWIYPDTTTTGDAIVTKDSAGNRSFYSEINGTGNIGAYINDTSGCYSTAVATTSAWTHISIVYDYIANGTSILTIYGNGSQWCQITNAVGPMANTASAFQIGAREYSTSRVFFDGLIDDVRFYNVARTQSEIQGDMNCSLLGTETGLVSYWRFDGDGNDSMATANNLTNENSAQFSNADLPFTNTCSNAPAVILKPSNLLMFNE